MAVVEFGPDRSLTAQVDKAAGKGADALAVAGGDGSLATVAAAAIEHDLPFVCVPAGTRNHFARDLGLDPADPTAALDALSDGLEAHIDVGEVNGSVFLNNVSFGIYAESIHHTGYRDRPRTGCRDLRSGSRRRPRRRPRRPSDRARLEQPVRP